MTSSDPTVTPADPERVQLLEQVAREAVALRFRLLLTGPEFADLKVALDALGRHRTAKPKRRRRRRRGDGLDGRRGLVDMGVASPVPASTEDGPPVDYDG